MYNYKNKYEITLVENEYRQLDKQLHIVSQYSALIDYLKNNKELFDGNQKYNEWVAMLTADTIQANYRLNEAKDKLSRNELSFVANVGPFEWVYEKPYHKVTVYTDADVEVPWEFQTRTPVTKIMDYQDSTMEVFKDEMPPTYDNTNTYSGRTITFQVTDGCNLRCSYCYQIAKHNHIMTKDIADKMIEILLCTEEENSYCNKNNIGIMIIDFIGGEPFLAVDMMDYICTRFIQRCFETENYRILRFIRFSTCSNGVLYRDPKIQKFLDKWKYLLSFSVTVDGNEQLHDACRVFPDGTGSYKYAMDAVEDCMKRGIIMGSKVTIAPNNVMYVYDAIKHMIDNGYHDIHANCVYEEGWTYDHAKIYYEQLKKLADLFLEKEYHDDILLALFNPSWYIPMSEEHDHNWCGGTGSMLAVNYTGNIYPCTRYMESSVGDNIDLILVGHTDHGLVKTDKEKETVNQLRSITRRSQSTDECWNCPIASGCGWCSAYNYQCTGTPNKRVTFICPMHKAEALANIYYWNKLCIKLPINHVPFLVRIPEEWALQIIDRNEWDQLNNLYQEAKNAKLSIEDRGQDFSE